MEFSLIIFNWKREKLRKILKLKVCKFVAWLLVEISRLAISRLWIIYFRSSK